MAVTTVPSDPDKYSQITFCPWFLDYAMSKAQQFQGQFKPAAIGQLALKVDTLVTKLKYTPIDLFSLFDKVVVHEVRML